ncbi:MAG: gamma-glutamyltransferase [Planctomycetota bacterium]|jgi:gamma-glutamyltranspeptidase/glutathione hydrolase
MSALRRLKEEIVQSRIIAHVLGIWVASVAICAHGQEPRVYHEGVVAADHEQASQAGARMLAMGGNAVDAAVATSFALSVVRPQSCGIGGGGFMVISLADDPDVEGDQSRVVALNYRETAPAAMGPDYFEGLRDVPEASTHTGHAVGVPGTVPGLLHALETYGTLDRATVMAPAIELARDGFLVDRATYKAASEKREWFAEQMYRMERHGFLWETFVREGALEENGTMTNPGQARALEIISEGGIEGWDGEIAPAIVQTVLDAGGNITLDDIRSYELQTLEPLRGKFKEFDIYTMPPPSSGGVALLQVLGILERVKEVGPMWKGGDLEVLVEAFKHAFADRARWLADGVDVAHLIRDDYLEELASRITPGQTYEPEFYGSAPQLPDDSGTSHLSVIDRYGNAVACTETINLHFGSKVAVDKYGFFLSNNIDDFTTISGEKNSFDLLQSDANLPNPGKRPLSSMTPTIVLDDLGDVVCVAGASGGPRIITSTTQVVLAVLNWTQVASMAVGAQRIHHQWVPNTLFVEQGILNHNRIKRAAPFTFLLLHRVEPLTKESAVQAIARHPGGGYTAASDPRKGGAPAGPEDVRDD